MRKIWTTIFILLLCACSNTPESQAQSVMLSKKQQRLAQTNPCLALATIKNGFEIRAYGEGSGLQQSDAYTEARINAESELMRKINDLTKPFDLKDKSSKKSKKIKNGKKSKGTNIKLPESAYYASGSLRGTRPVLVKYHTTPTSSVCRICLAMPFDNITPPEPTKQQKRKRDFLMKRLRIKLVGEAID